MPEPYSALPDRSVGGLPLVHGGPARAYAGIPVVTPAQFWPFGGSNDMFFDLSVLARTRVIDAAIDATTTPAACSPRLRL